MSQFLWPFKLWSWDCWQVGQLWRWFRFAEFEREVERWDLHCFLRYPSLGISERKNRTRVLGSDSWGDFMKALEVVNSHVFRNTMVGKYGSCPVQQWFPTTCLPGAWEDRLPDHVTTSCQGLVRGNEHLTFEHNILSLKQNTSKCSFLSATVNSHFWMMAAQSVCRENRVWARSRGRLMRKQARNTYLLCSSMETMGVCYGAQPVLFWCKDQTWESNAIIKVGRK